MNEKLVSQDVESILYNILNNSSLHTMITGGIFKEGYRPTNSEKEDIVISTLTLTQDQPQIAVCNINVYIPDIKQTTINVVESIPNTIKLKSIAKSIKKVIDEALINPLYKDLSLRVDFQRTFKNQDTEKKEHFQNLRIELIIPNNN